MNAQVFGKYQLLKRLATGGMAEVWLARHLGIEGFQRLLVVKRILPHLADDPEFVQMFLNEAKIAARFNHPNIAQIYDLGETNGTYYIAMEYVHGEDLGRVMRKAWSSGQWVARPLAIRIVASACEALYYAHTKADERGTPLRVVHRDVSPQNILISFDGTVKLVDFGIAKAADAQSMTRSGAIKGKFAYMSPEQASGKPLDHRSDIFAIGLVLYELLTGVRPLKRDSELATLQAALECGIEPPSRVADVPEDLDPIVMSALCRSADDRYRDARAFQMALEEFLVSQRWVATSVQVAELMSTLFQDRLDEESRLGYPAPVPDDGSASSAAPIAPAPPSGTGPGLVTDAASSPEVPAAGRARPATPASSDVAAQRAEASVVSAPDVPSWDAPPGVEVPARRRTSEPRGDGRRGTLAGQPTGLARAPSRSDAPLPAPRTRSAVEVPRSRSQPGIRRAEEERAAGHDDALTRLPDLEPPSSAGGDDEPRKSGQFSLGIARKLSEQRQMPEPPAPPVRRKSGERPRPRAQEEAPELAPVAPRRAVSQDRDLQAFEEGLTRRGAQAWKVAIGLALTATVAVAAVVFRGDLSAFLTRTANDGSEIILSVDSNLPCELYLKHHADEGRGAEPVSLGRNPLKRISGVHARDTLIFINRPLGLEHAYELPPSEPGKHQQIVREFNKGTYQVRLLPKELTNVTLYLAGQQVGHYPGPKLELVEGKHTLEAHGPQLREPVRFEIEIEPGKHNKGDVIDLRDKML